MEVDKLSEWIKDHTPFPVIGRTDSVSASWVPTKMSAKMSLRPLYDSLCLGQSHQWQQNGTVVTNPLPMTMGRRPQIPVPPYQPFAKDSLVSMEKGWSSAQENGSIPPSDLARFATDKLEFTWPERDEKVILGPYTYIASEPGKEMRTMLLNSFNEWLEVPADSLAVITEVIRMLHTASLLIDDIQDNSMLRRGRPVAHNVFGVAQTINSSNYMYFLALKELQKLRNASAATEIFITEMMYLHRGQGMDLYWRDTLTCPTEADYLQMVSNKTGGLFRLAVKLMQAESPTSIDCMPLVQMLGLAFQIADDYKNLANQDYTQQKGICEDLTEGKFSFPVIHSIRADPTDTQLLHILAMKPEDVDVKRHAVRCMERTGSLEYTKAVVGVLIARAKDVTNAIDHGRGKCKGIHALLDKLALH